MTKLIKSEENIDITEIFQSSDPKIHEKTVEFFQTAISGSLNMYRDICLSKNMDKHAQAVAAARLAQAFLDSFEVFRAGAEMMCDGKPKTIESCNNSSGVMNELMKTGVRRLANEAQRKVIN